MAPEIVSKREFAGPPADVWALGILYFALICGRFPFKGSSDKELYKKICKYDLDFSDCASPHARFFLHKILKKDAQDRPTALELLQDSYLAKAEEEF